MQNSHPSHLHNIQTFADKETFLIFYNFVIEKLNM